MQHSVYTEKTCTQTTLQFADVVPAGGVLLFLKLGIHLF